MQLARAELQIGRVEIGHDEEDNLVEIRKTLILLVDAEEVRIAPEDGLLAWHVLRDAPRTARHDLVGRRAHVVRGGKIPLLVGLLEHVLGHDAHVGGAFHQRSVRRGRLDDDGVGVGRGDLEWLAAHDQEVLRRRMQGFVVHDLKTEEDVLSGNRVPVREFCALAQMVGPRQAVGAISHDLASQGIDFCATLSYSVSVANVRSVMSLDDCSFAMMALNVRGF